ncbi:MAG: FecR domain-containing protein [Mangrovibacterium sp.]
MKARIIAYLDGELGEEECRELADWLTRSDANARYYARIRDLWESSRTEAFCLAETEKAWNKFIASTQGMGYNRQHKVPVVRTARITRLAAVLVLGMVLGGFIAYYSGTTPAKTVQFTASAPKGSVARIILPDHTEVYLNAGTELCYTAEAGAKNREVTLSGEAWFKVRKNRELPFLVHTGYYTVKVLGTEFNVKNYAEDNRLETTLEKGKIVITSSDKLRLKEELMLNPGEQLVLNKEKNSLRVRDVDPLLYSSWKNNKLQFLRLQLGELITLLERRYGVEIEVNEPGILNYHYSGTIKNESILEVLEILQHTLPIRYEIDDQIVKIYKRAN